ncbi:hypothetical protein ['Camptotheca acuminata' phytoplasma]|uniref:hypothetical protein n=1 Tax='Camptotheca acuminata' phytoplasma TaxID=3239192 RepID=UPI00351A9491
MKKNKLKILFFVFGLFIFLFLIFSLVIAYSNHLFKQKKEEIKLLNNFPILEIEGSDKNNLDKFLLPISVPNLNQNKYEHLIKIEHIATLFSKGMTIKEPLFLKIEVNFDSQNTFLNPKEYFNIEIITTDANDNKLFYKDEQKPCFEAMNENETQQIKIFTKIEQKNIINANEPKLFLIYDYDIVDKQGNAITGGNSLITQEVMNINKK